jgi:DNA-binding MarR family transcriptional regulator
MPTATPAPAPAPARLAGDLLAMLGHVIHSQQHRVFRAAADLDLTLAQLQGLCALRSADRPLALHDLVDSMGLSVGATSRAVDALVRAGLVTRTEDALDRRVKRVALTDAGRDVLERLNEARRAGLETFAETLSPEEREGLSDALRPILDRLGAA